MKKLKRVLLQGGTAVIPVLCYAVCLTGWLLVSLFGLGRDTLMKANGSLAPFDLRMEDFTAVDMEQTEPGVWHTYTDDPQLHWQNADARALRTLRMQAEFSKSPREMCLYYTTRPGEDFSQDKRVFAAQQADGSYLYTLPAGKISALRLDPCSARNLDIKVQLLSCNEPASPVSYFAPGWYGLFQLLLWPAAAAAALSLLADCVLWFKNKKEIGNTL